jgi:hypothetical protein
MPSVTARCLLLVHRSNAGPGENIMVNFASSNPSRSSQKPRFLRANLVYVDPEPIVIHAPHAEESTDDRLIVNKENGTIKGFQYRCTCGRVDHFVCE